MEEKNPRGAIYSLGTHAKGRDTSTRLVGQLTRVVLPGSPLWGREGEPCQRGTPMEVSLWLVP